MTQPLCKIEIKRPHGLTLSRKRGERIIIGDYLAVEVTRFYLNPPAVEISIQVTHGDETTATPVQLRPTQYAVAGEVTITAVSVGKSKASLRVIAPAGTNVCRAETIIRTPSTKTGKHEY